MGFPGTHVHPVSVSLSRKAVIEDSITDSPLKSKYLSSLLLPCLLLLLQHVWAVCLACSTCLCPLNPVPEGWLLCSFLLIHLILDLYVSILTTVSFVLLPSRGRCGDSTWLLPSFLLPF